MLRKRISTEAVVHLAPAELCQLASASLLERKADFHFWKAVSKRAVEVAPHLNSTQAARLIHLIHSGDASSCDSMIELSKVIINEATAKAEHSSVSLGDSIELNSIDVRKLVLALCRGKAYDSDLLTALLDNACKTIGAYSPHHLLSMIQAIARVNLAHESFITRACESLDISGISLHECVSLTESLSRIQAYDAPLFDSVTEKIVTGAAQLDVEDLRRFFLTLIRLKKLGVERDDSAAFAVLVPTCLRPQIRRLETRELFQIFFSTVELGALDGPFIRERLIPTVRKRLTQERGLQSAALALQLLSRLPFTCPGGDELRQEALIILDAATPEDAQDEPAAVVAGAIAGARVWDALEAAGPAVLEGLKDGEFRALADAAAREGRLLHALKVERLRRSI